MLYVIAKVFAITFDEIVKEGEELADLDKQIAVKVSIGASYVSPFMGRLDDSYLFYYLSKNHKNALK